MLTVCIVLEGHFSKELGTHNNGVILYVIEYLITCEMGYSYSPETINFAIIVQIYVVE